MFTSLTRNTLIQAIERIVSVLLGFATVAALTRLLGVEGFGTYSTIIVLVQFAASLVDFGLGLTLSQLIAEPKAQEQKILQTIVPLRIATSVTAFTLTAGITILLPYSREIVSGVVAISGAFVGLQISQLLAGYFRAHLSIWVVATAEVFQRTVYLVVLGWLFLANGAVGELLPTILWAATITQLFAAGFLVWAIHRRVKLTFGFDLAIARLILRRNLPLTLSMLATLFYFKADTVILSLYRSSAEVGLYSAPYKLLETLVNLPHLFLSLVLPLATAAWANRDLEQLKKLWQWSFTTTVLITLPMTVGGLLVAKPLITAVAGTAFVPATPLLQILLVATALIMLGTQSAYIVLATGKQQRILLIYIVASTVTVGAYFWLIPHFGAFAAAWITLAVEAVMALANTILAARTLVWFPQIKPIMPIMVASAIMGLVVWLTRSQPFALVMALAMATYLAALPQLGFKFDALQKT